jgi:hypothetical protein
MQLIKKELAGGRLAGLQLDEEHFEPLTAA